MAIGIPKNFYIFGTGSVWSLRAKVAFFLELQSVWNEVTTVDDVDWSDTLRLGSFENELAAFYLNFTRVVVILCLLQSKNSINSIYI